MKQKLREVLTVNTVLAAVLVLLAVAAFAGRERFRYFQETNLQYIILKLKKR